MYSLPSETKDSRLDWNLENWRNWMKYHNIKLGFPTRSLGIKNGASWDTEEQEGMMDTRTAIIMDALINDLETNQRLVVWHLWLHSTIRFPIRELDKLYETARMILMEGMDKRGIY